MQRNKALPILLLAIGLLCCYFGGRLLVADISAWQASRFVDDWMVRQGVGSERAWLVAESAANRAIAVTPAAMAIHHERLGRIHEWRHLDLPYGNEAALASRLAARDAYRRAIELRPLWPYTWLRLAYIKLRLVEFDEEFDRAMREAVALGPWRITVNKTIAEIGLIAWQELDSVQRELVLEAANRTLLQNARAGAQLLAFAEQFHRLDDVCDHLAPQIAKSHNLCINR